MSGSAVPSVVADTKFGNCDTCEEPIRKRGRYGQWVHVTTGLATSEIVALHRATPKVPEPRP